MGTIGGVLKFSGYHPFDREESDYTVLLENWNQLMHRRSIRSAAIASHATIQWEFPTLKQVQTALCQRNQPEPETEYTQLTAIEVLMRPA